ncbi:hypothetical protein SCHIN_v1c09170 [Spiroplasma chinense]|uniref:Uncharacterized protein n=1 Tax=Spiroplasma chinense TaxID=216932 RepID=A0A5B9Y7N8_9MOLU|nr:hypothetical protein [Spiroplasma chinense]QEH62112.1 hypothetical protein SCHIN_v1c09170 [Spiroplasma chinense]
MLKKFNEKYTKTLNISKVEQLTFKWQFTGFPEIVNVNDVFTYLEFNLKTQFNKTQENDIQDKIEVLRQFFNKYFNLIDLKTIENPNIVNDFLLKFYTNIRDFINTVFVEYVLYSHLHSEIKYKEQFIDIDDYYELKLNKLNKTLIKQTLITLNSLNKNDEKYSQIINELKQEK